MPFSVNSYTPPSICKLEPSCDDTNSGRLFFLNLWTYFSLRPSRIAVYSTPSNSPTTNPVFGFGNLTRSAYRASWPLKSANNSAACRSCTRLDAGTGFLRAVRLFPRKLPLFAQRSPYRAQHQLVNLASLLLTILQHRAPVVLCGIKHFYFSYRKSQLALCGYP